MQKRTQMQSLVIKIVIWFYMWIQTRHASPCQSQEAVMQVILSEQLTLTKSNKTQPRDKWPHTHRV